MTLQMLTSCTDIKGTSTHAGKTTLDLQGKEWQSVTKCLEWQSGWDNLHRVEFPTHLSPPLSTYFCLTKSPFHPFKGMKGFLRREGEKSSYESLCGSTKQGTTTELKCHGAWRGTHYGDREGGHWWPPLAKSGLYLKRGGKNRCQHLWGTTLRTGTWEEQVWASQMPSRGALERGQNWVCTGPRQDCFSWAS